MSATFVPSVLRSGSSTAACGLQFPKPNDDEACKLRLSRLNWDRLRTYFCRSRSQSIECHFRYHDPGARHAPWIYELPSSEYNVNAFRSRRAGRGRSKSIRSSGGRTGPCLCENTTPLFASEGDSHTGRERRFCSSRAAQAMTREILCDPPARRLPPRRPARPAHWKKVDVEARPMNFLAFEYTICSGAGTYR